MSGKYSRWGILPLLLIAIVIAACGTSSDEEVATVDPNRVRSAQTAFAPNTSTPRPRPTPTPVPDIEVELARTASRMADAVLNQDEAAYFSLLVQDDPLFLEEQRAWAQAWLELAFEKFQARVSSIRIVDEQTAIARLTMEWTQGGPNRDGKSGGATITARFVRSNDDADLWLFSGEAWEIVHAYWDGNVWLIVWPGDDAAPADFEERMRLYYLPQHGPIQGTRSQVEDLLENVPEYYTVTVNELDLTPDEMLHIKYYDSTLNMRTMVRIGLPPLMITSNRVGQSLKLAVLDFTSPIEPPNIPFLIAEALVNQLVTQPDDYPQWLVHGASWFVYGNNYQTVTWRNNRIEQVAAQLLIPGESFLQNAPDSTMAMVALMYIDDAYGSELRNQWLKAIVSSEMSVEEATEAILGLPLDEFESLWQEWVEEQLP